MAATWFELHKVGMPESSLAEDDEPMESPDPVQDGPAGAVSKSVVSK